MLYKYKNILWLTCILLINFTFINKIFAQSTCNQSLKQAVADYNEGLFDKVIAVLPELMANCEFSKADILQAQRILIAAYYEVDELELADDEMYSFLKKNPYYSVNYSSDPEPFIKGLSKYEVKPKLSIGFNLGLNNSTPLISQRYSVWEKANYDNEYETEFSAVGSDLFISYSLFRNFDIRLGFSTLGIYYSREIPLADDYKLKVIEEAARGFIPLSVNYSVPINKKWIPSFTLGFYASQFVNSPTVKIESNKTDLLPEGQKLDAIDVKFLRNAENVGILWGFGVSFKRNYLKYSVSLVNYYDVADYINKENKFKSNNLYTDFYYIDDDIKLKYSKISIGVEYYFHHKVSSKY